jgi:hypothetical protein
MDLPTQPEPLKVSVTFSGPTATEIRRICDNLDIGVPTFIKKAVKGELRAMGIVVE